MVLDATYIKYFTVFNVKNAIFVLFFYITLYFNHLKYKMEQVKKKFITFYIIYT